MALAFGAGEIEGADPQGLISLKIAEVEGYGWIAALLRHGRR